MINLFQLDGSLPDVNGLSPDGNPPPALGAANVSHSVVPGQVCADGSLPDVNGLSPDGNPPPALRCCKCKSTCCTRTSLC